MIGEEYINWAEVKKLYPRAFDSYNFEYMDNDKCRDLYDFFDEWATCRKSDKNIAHGTASINCITKV